MDSLIEWKIIVLQRRQLKPTDFSTQKLVATQMRLIMGWTAKGLVQNRKLRNLCEGMALRMVLAANVY